MADLSALLYLSVLQNTVESKRLTIDWRKWMWNIEDKILVKCVKVDITGGNIDCKKLRGPFLTILHPAPYLIEIILWIS